MLTRTMRLTASVIAGVALSVAGAGVAQASNGADDPPGHEANHHQGHHHHHHQHHGAEHGANHG